MRRQVTAAVVALVFGVACSPPPAVRFPTETAGTPSGPPAEEPERAWQHLAVVEGMLPHSAAAAAAEGQGDFDTVWRRHEFPADAPAVDFERNVVLFLGQPDDDCVDELIELEARNGVLRPKWLPPPGGCTQPLVFRIHAVKVDRRHLPPSFDVAFPEPYEHDAQPVTITIDTRAGDAPKAPKPPVAMTEEELGQVFADHPVQRCAGEPAWMAKGGAGGSQAEAGRELDHVRRWLRSRGLRADVDYVPFISRRNGVRAGLLVDNGKEDFIRREVEETFGTGVVDVLAHAYDFEAVDRAQRDLRALMGGDGPGSIFSSTGIPGPVKLGMIDPTRKALDRIAATVDPGLVCVDPHLSGVRR